MPQEQTDWVSLRSAELTAAVDPLGAQLSVLRDRHGRDLLWHGDAAWWSGRAPILFPIVGVLAGGVYRLGNTSAPGLRQYPLGRHGFVRTRRFAVMAATADSAVFRCVADEATLAVYPFHFELDMAFALDGATLSMRATVRNVGDEVLPASLGFHPAFRWPLSSGQARAAHCLEFEAEEPAGVRRITRDGLLLPQAQPTPIVDRRMALDDALFEPDVIILDQLHSRSLTYAAPGGPRLQIGFPDARYLGIWTRPGAPFLCIEPWQGITDPVGFAGEFRSKPGIFLVPPGATQSQCMTVAVSEP